MTENLKRERREIDSMDMLEEIHDTQTGVVDIAAGDRNELESNWRDIAGCDHEVWLGRTAADSASRKYEVGPGGKVAQFERGNRLPLVPPRILARERHVPQLGDDAGRLQPHRRAA